ncbi:redoxin domain-containing protein [Evansella cellulosilytica]|uniref:Alkyl hydroperoxide reductase/ Thiol specific antioxidant/ Mal allergen n=1 Tax=Evansella cellulosilytica (strain ATCC 21833 / DSM 2522 / FERM P-1141 / JCM 9156 / N-4) TaxID=649639 RepID=E6TTG0_EVAC2|nr:redoxin domain-containing protein [Evansella cellulosilytica]ADU29596.1 alkyl hydroperoxide reductase/ Thiol specific antioxidant/ Mal allergen [Evansella cellulosilytica DSM 2522]
MKKNLLIGALLVGMIVWAIIDSIEWNTEETAKVGVSNEEVGIFIGDIAPDFQLTTLDGDRVKLSDYRGQKIMLNFWATWCPPCRAEMPDMQRAYEENDIIILAVNLTETESRVENVETFADDFELTFPILLDERTEVADLFAVQPVPTSFMIDTTGRIEHVAIGPMNEDMIIQKINEMN